jgi:hypothetical protein
MVLPKQRLAEQTVDVAHRKKMCTSPALLRTASRAESTNCAAGLRKAAAFLHKPLNYLVFFCDGDFVVIS